MTIGADLDGARLDAAVRAALEVPWSRVRTWIQSGKVQVDGQPAVDPGQRVRAGQHVDLQMNAPKRISGRLASDSVAFVDSNLIVVHKPPGVNSIPFDKGERGTLQEMVRVWLSRTASARRDRRDSELGVVHRIDKETSGLMVFARTLSAKRSLDEQLRRHTVERVYLAIAHGRVVAKTIRSRLIADRGDGIRGSTADPRLGRPAVTHVEPMGELAGATLVRCRLETGRTHQIRIHLSESGYPLLGERVYIRGIAGPFLSAPRMMLHAAVLGFEHPVDGRSLRFEAAMPPDMERVVASLRIGST